MSWHALPLINEEKLYLYTNQSGVLAVLVVAENKEEFNAVLELSNR